MLFDRQLLEDREAQTLAPYATLSSQSRGRHHPEPESKSRTAFQRDRDRVIHTTAFRRLEYKTQVFLNSQDDHYRNRLTHTLEVAQVGRTVALALGLNETLAETLALAHDLGHAPFGHAGETILNGLMTEYGGFDHNVHTLRIVTRLEDRYPDFVGLNLTRATLDGLAKHSQLSSGQHSLEAQLVDVADGLAYSAHDLDDVLRSKLISPYDLRGLEIWEELMSRLKLKPDHLSEKDRRTLQRELLGWLASDLVASSNARLTEHHILTPQDVAKQSAPLISFSPEMDSKLRGLWHFMRDHLYEHPSILRQVTQAEHALEGLWDSYRKRPGMLPAAALAHIDQDGLERVIGDHLAGMTDRYALEEYRQLYGAGA